MSIHDPRPTLTNVTDNLKDHPEYSAHERVFEIDDPASGLKARVFIHSLVEGRALGGCRRWVYEDEAAWSADGLRLSRGMTRKAAVAGLPLGGAKAAIWHEDPTPEMMRAFGQGLAMIESDYGMTYITAEDVGISEALLKEVKKYTANVRGITPETGEDVAGGDPGPFTAYGVFAGMEIAAKRKLGKGALKDVRVAIQGLGDVGYYLCRFLHDAGAQIFVADLDAARVKRVQEEFNAIPVRPEDIISMDVDIFAPCAMGGVLCEDILAPIVAGSSNNQQRDEKNNAESKMLMDKGILYAPDYVINAGGLISVYYENVPAREVMDMIYKQVQTSLDRIFTAAEKQQRDTATVADELSLKMLQETDTNMPLASRMAAA